MHPTVRQAEEDIERLRSLGYEPFRHGKRIRTKKSRGNTKQEREQYNKLKDTLDESAMIRALKNPSI